MYKINLAHHSRWIYLAVYMTFRRWRLRSVDKVDLDHWNEHYDFHAWKRWAITLLFFSPTSWHRYTYGEEWDSSVHMFHRCVKGEHSGFDVRTTHLICLYGSLCWLNRTRESVRSRVWWSFTPSIFLVARDTTKIDSFTGVQMFVECFEQSLKHVP
jgi:hypothetical protein